MQSKNVGHHKLGSRGYLGKRPMWAKEDEQYIREGRTIPWDEFEDQQERDYVRARYNTDPETGEFVTDPVVKDLEIRLVINLTL